MTLASLLAAGAPLRAVEDSLQRLGVSFDIETDAVEVSGVRALRLEVATPEQYTHRTFSDVEALVSSAELPGRAANRAIEAFRRLAAAEELRPIEIDGNQLREGAAEIDEQDDGCHLHQRGS